MVGSMLKHLKQLKVLHPNIISRENIMDEVTFKIMKLHLDLLENVETKLLEPYRRLLTEEDINRVHAAAQQNVITAEESDLLILHGIRDSAAAAISVRIGGIMPTPPGGAEELESLNNSITSTRKMLDVYRRLYGWM